MIARLKGVVAAVAADSVLIDVHGVGYRAAMPLSDLGRLPAPGEEATLYTHTYVREDALALYAFLDEPTLSLFEMLLTVSGVGPRVALALLSVLTTSELMNAIAGDDPRQLQRAPGVGLKSAQRIVLELKDRVQAMPRAAAAGPVPTTAGDAVDALQSLGYRQPEAARAVEQAVKEAGAGADTGRVLRVALRILTQGG